MKLKINYYILKSLKANSIYILALILVVGLLVYILIVWTSEYSDNADQIQSAQLEIEKLQKRKKNLENLISSNFTEVKEFNLILNKLIPDTEDFFSVIYALEKISQETNFLISKYVINLSSATSDRFSLSVNGDGDIEAFYNFLDKYNFGSGRLITMNNFDFNNTGIQYSLNLTFYNKEIPKEFVELGSIPTKNIAFMREVKSKVEFLLKSPQTSQDTPDDFQYPTTQNLF